MKANELRIGNYIQDQGGKILRIDWFEQNKACMQMFVNYIEVHPLTEHFDSMQPIPLTEEWLMKFGFEALFSGAGYVKNHVEIGYNHNGFYIITSGLKIKYVHQLQNLYFALTGEELTIK